MNDRIMNTYIYTTRDVVEALKKNGIIKNTMQISKYIRDNNLDGRGMAIKNIEPIPGLNETHEVWRISMYGTNEILKYFLDKRRQENSKKYVYEIKQLVKKYKKEYSRCNESAIVVFINENKYAERNLAIKTGAGSNCKWLISQEGVNEMLLKLFRKRPVEEKGFIYGLENIRKELRKTRTLKNNSNLIIYLEQLESEGLAAKVPTKNGSFDVKTKSQFRWRISEEGLEKVKNKLPIKNNTLDIEDYEQIHLPDKEVQEKQKPITYKGKTITYKENVYEIVLDDEYSGYLSIISKSLNKNEVDVIRNLVEKFIDDKKEKIANIINF